METGFKGHLFWPFCIYSINRALSFPCAFWGLEQKVAFKESEADHPWHYKFSPIDHRLVWSQQWHNMLALVLIEARSKSILLILFSSAPIFHSWSTQFPTFERSLHLKIFQDEFELWSALVTIRNQQTQCEWQHHFLRKKCQFFKNLEKSAGGNLNLYLAMCWEASAT